jgi:hypothetical protein
LKGLPFMRANGGKLPVQPRHVQAAFQHVFKVDVNISERDIVQDDAQSS